MVGIALVQRAIRLLRGIKAIVPLIRLGQFGM
jgi:hypothetical protein